MQVPHPTAVSCGRYKFEVCGSLLHIFKISYRGGRSGILHWVSFFYQH